jgi:short-subunit dehydrogenase
MKQRGWGRILQVASLGAYQPLPFYASYAAAKAFVLNYGIAIGQELAGSGVTVTVLSPGFTKTEFFDVAGHAAAGHAAFLMMSPKRAVRVGLRALARGKGSVTPGVMNKLIAFSTRFASRAFAARIARTFTGAARPHGD